MNRKSIFQQRYLDGKQPKSHNFSMAKRVITRFKQKERRRIFVREWRKYRGLTQEALAERVGWGVSNISQLEQGRQGYSQEGLEALADALRCEPGQLLDVDPTRGDEGIWSIWETAKPGERQMIVNLAKQVVGKTGTDQ
jgi:ribosome-binding protein aMBF1 (putative translation factor)